MHTPVDAATSVSVVLPLYLQRDQVDAMLPELFGAVADVVADVEIIVVPNGPDDGTAAHCRALREQYPWLVVLDQQPPGWGAAVMTGVRAARHHLICYTNAARTRPTDLRTAVSLAVLNPDTAVKAVRRTREHWIRRLGSVIYNLEARALFGLASWDVNGTPKVFPRRFDELLQLTERGDLLDVEWLVAVGRHDRQLLEYPLLSTQRRGGRSTTGWKSAFVMYTGAIRLHRRLRSSSAARTS